MLGNAQIKAPAGNMLHDACDNNVKNKIYYENRNTVVIEVNKKLLKDRRLALGDTQEKWTNLKTQSTAECGISYCVYFNCSRISRMVME